MSEKDKNQKIDTKQIQTLYKIPSFQAYSYDNERKMNKKLVGLAFLICTMSSGALMAKATVPDDLTTFVEKGMQDWHVPGKVLAEEFDPNPAAPQITAEVCF